ncbi:hypothetical protein SDC9_21487 [bioreactor metagenome]|uniref:Uncharacterized protein n=1 Tax=bioreactor metagenome TaxID=1076179 RepID=A0A644U9N9_9ZZZZ|nr:hypothetical protein [Methanobrevibacter sp.]MEA4956686.1 hypothetical protein [Methanobrevibacter sp.]
MKLKVIFIILISFFIINGINAHGVDVTEDVMVLSDDSTGIMAKKLAEDMNFDVKVYKFTSQADVEHQLEHALSNKNKKILVVAYQNVTNEFLKKHQELSNRIIVVNSDEDSIKNGLINLKELNSTENTNSKSSQISNNNVGNMHLDFTSLILIVVIIALVSTIGTFIVKRKK